VLWVIRVALQPERSQTLHIFHCCFVLCVCLLEGNVNFGLPAFALIEKRLGDFAMFCAHHILLFGDVAIMHYTAQKFLQLPTEAAPTRFSDQGRSPSYHGRWPYYQLLSAP
jgi:hypothetical protein